MTVAAQTYVYRDDSGRRVPGPELFPVYSLGRVTAGRLPSCCSCDQAIEMAETSTVLLRGSLPLCSGCALMECPDVVAREGLLGIAFQELAAQMLMVGSDFGTVGACGGRVLQVMSGFFDPDEGPEGASLGLERLAEAARCDWLAQCDGSRERMLEVCLGERAGHLARDLGVEASEVLDAVVGDPETSLRLIEEGCLEEPRHPFRKLDRAVRAWFASDTFPPVEQSLGDEPAGGPLSPPAPPYSALRS